MTSAKRVSANRMPGRWVGILAAGALMLGACGSATEDAAVVDEVDETPATLPLESTPTTAGTIPDSDLDQISGSSELDDVELTPELFEELKADEESRSAVLEEMQAQGLTTEEAECFLDSVSPGLFVTFGSGEQPDEAEFAELLQLLETCEIAFGAQS